MDASYNRVSIEPVDECCSNGKLNTEAQAVDEYETETVPDSDDEGTDTGDALAHSSVFYSCRIEGHAETKAIAVANKQEILCNTFHQDLERAAVNTFCTENKGQCYTGSPMLIANHFCNNLECNEDAKEDSMNILLSCKKTFFHPEKDVNMQVDCHSEELRSEEQKQRPSSEFDRTMGFGAKSQGSDELSLAHSLDFVDQYLAAHLEGINSCVTSAVSEKSKSSISKAKGPQHLVSLTRLAKSKSRINDEGPFKWVDHLEDELNYQLFSSSKDTEQTLIGRSMGLEDTDLRKQRIYPPSLKPRDQCYSILENSRDFSISGRRMPLSDVRKASSDGLRPKLENGKGSFEELDLLINRESYQSKLEAGVENIDANFYEVGIGTQIAAEAMEAMFFAEPPSDAHCYPAGTSDGSANVTTRGSCSEVGSIQKSPCYKPVVGGNRKKSGSCFRKHRKSQDSWSGDDMCQEPTKKLRTHKALHTSSKANSYLRNFTSLDPYSGAAKLKAQGNLKEVVQSNSKRNIKKKVLHTGNSRKKCVEVDDASYCRKRKMMDSIADNRDVSRQNKSSLKVSFETSADANNDIISQGDEQQIDLQNFTVLDYPRGKRFSRVNDSVKLLNMNECNMAAIRTQGSSESILESFQTSFSWLIKKKKRTSVYRSIPICVHKKKSRGKLQGCNRDDLGLISSGNEHDSLVRRGIRLDQFKNQSDANSSSSLCHGKYNASSVQSRNSVNAASSHGKHPDKKRESISPLTKELIRLGCVDSMPDFTSKDLRRRRTMSNIQVLLSQNLEVDILKQQKKILAWFGVPTASCPSDATHFVADKFTRTRNMLEIIARGKPVVTHLWLDSCKEAGFCIDERKYILRDVKKERELGFSLPNSLVLAGRQPLLRGYKVYVTQNVKPTQEVISSLVKNLQGELVVDLACDFQSKEKVVDNFLILSCEEDLADCSPLLQKGAIAYTSELLLNGVIIQKLEFHRHQLLFNHLASN